MRAERSFWVRILLPGGDPEGIRIVEKSNWTGQGLVFPRALFTEARQRAEMKRTGVYVLWGPAESGEQPRVYVGEGDPVAQRLEQHARSKDFWTHGLVFTSKDQNLNKAHVQHIEARLVAIAAAAKRCELDNGNQPQPPSLSEADLADAEGYLADMLLCLPVVSVSFFQAAKAPLQKATMLRMRAKGIEATGFETPQGFLVKAGSRMVASEVNTVAPHLTSQRRELIERGVFVRDGQLYRLIQDYTFASPSAAAGVLLGRTANGRIEWKDANGRTLKEIQDREASS